MSTMSVLDLQCQEAMDAVELTLAHMGYEDDDLIPAIIVVETVKQAAFAYTPIEGWECTMPYMLQWAYERFDLLVPRLN